MERRHLVWRNTAGIAALLSLPLLLAAKGRDSNITWGSSQFRSPNAAFIRTNMTARVGGGSLSYLSRVGGVAFGGVAKSGDGSRVIDLRYNRSRPDGQRLEVTLKTADGQSTTVTAKIHDWQMIPIARYASNREEACFTLFGRLENESDEQSSLSQLTLTEGERLRREGFRTLNYNKAFYGNLLGLRMFHGDVMLFYPGAWRLPERNGSPLLGPGEPSYEEATNRKNLQAISAFQKSLRRKYGSSHRSYLITDPLAGITFGQQNGALALSGQPFWSCWRYKASASEATAAEKQELTQDTAVALAEERQAEKRKLSAAEFRRRWTKQYEAQVRREIYETLAEAVVLDRKQKQLEEQCVREAMQQLGISETELLTRQDEVIKKSREILIRKEDQVMLQRMPQYSRDLSRKIEQLGGVTPQVYASLKYTMRYSAFFRHVQKNKPREFRAFLASLIGRDGGVVSVTTPTAWKPDEE